MIPRNTAWHVLGALTVASLVCLAGTGLADEDGGWRGRSRGWGWDRGRDRAEAFKGKGKAADSRRAPELRLPPGLARKPPDHPGRVAWLKAHGGKQQGTGAVKDKGRPRSDRDMTAKAKGRRPDEARKTDERDRIRNLEQRLDRLLQELESIRRELRKR